MLGGEASSNGVGINYSPLIGIGLTDLPYPPTPHHRFWLLSYPFSSRMQKLLMFFFLFFRMRLLLSAALAVSAASVVLGQRPARIGPDGKPLLNRPVMVECQKSEWKSYENFFGRTLLWSSKQSLNFCQNSFTTSSDISKEYFEFEDCQANNSLVCIMWIESQLQCNLDLVTLLVSAKTVTKLHNVTKSNDFM